MTTLILFFAAFTVTAFTAGRLYEGNMASQRRAEERETARILHRPEVTVTDGGWCDDRDHTALLDDGPGGRHRWGRVVGSSGQLAAWAADTAEWALVRRHFVDDAQLEAVAT